MPIYKSSTPTKDGRCYFFKARYIDGEKYKQKRSKLYSTKLDALKAEYRFLIKWEESKVDLPVSLDIAQLYKKFYKSRIEKGVKKNTLQQYNRQFKYMSSLHKTKCIDLEAGHIEAWKKELNTNESFTTEDKNRMLKLIKSLLYYGMIEIGFDFQDILNKVEPFVSNEVHDIVHFYTEDQVVKFLKAEKDLRYKCLWMMLFYQGLKTSEVKGLTWNCISFRKKTVTVKQQLVSGKNDDGTYKIERLKSPSNIRTLPLIGALKRNLYKYYRIVKEQEGFNKKTWLVFGESYGKHVLNYNFAIERKNEIMRKKKLSQITFSEFRHTCAYLLLTHGANIIAISKFFGYYEATDCMKMYSFMLPMGMTEVVDIINKHNREYKG